MRPARVFSIILLSAGLVSSHPAAAAPGDLDPGFGTGGIVTTDLGVDASVLALTIGADGRILAGGVAWGNAASVGLARYTGAGALETSVLSGTHDFVNSVAFPADGSVLAGVSVPFGGPCCQFAVARLGTDGTPDPAFGAGGVAATSIGPANVQGVLRQPDGKVVAVGKARIPSDALAVLRFDSDGTLDTSFGVGGVIVRGGAAGAAVALQPDGAIVVAGYELVGGTQHVLVARYGASGAPDPAFGGTGSVTTTVGARSAAVGLALQADGKIVVAGHARRADGRHVFAVLRYLADGVLDASFGAGGVTEVEIEAHAYAYAVALQPDGKVVVGGEAERLTSGLGVLALARLDAGGTLDAGFGTGGVVATSGGGDFDAIWQLGLQPDGKIVAGGWSTDGVTFRMRFMLARFEGTAVAQGPRYDFTGFFRPVKNAPEINVARAGSVVPVKFSLGGDRGLSIFPVDASGQAMYPASVPVSCTTFEPEPDGAPVTTSQRLNYDEDDDRYVYVWKTMKAWGGTCRRLTVTLDDGTTHRANFRFAR
jgi:uncharacterized delta-60 repeat protein